MFTDRGALALVGAAIVAVAVTGCASPAGEKTVVVVETITEVVDAPAPRPQPVAGGIASRAGGLEGFNEFAQRLPAQVGIAVVPVGGGQALTGGTLSTDVAWSTIKVPLAIAALAADPSQIGNATAAITTSDNQAAQAMWDSLGGGTSAAAQVRQVLTRFGDPATVVQSQVTRPGYSAFGQTEWPLISQAQFAAMLPCSDDAETVLSLMNRIASDQDWGLGALSGAQFKGGWGPGPSGQYLVRQVGIVESASGRVAVALAAAPTSGTFIDGIAALDQVTRWLGDRLSTLSAGAGC
ncbi:hypothetical protein [Prescottella agglutinans]|uniref:Serine hydrolase n=1 Tax=Prescottella agglutinans TaxID=1644129 RepID=A0ABT6MJM7_9NOCA|nr:hypothetical protein [Prescottella agglutinans]MDH6284099.1 hypothetical protein [Prescottella agglutinans]